MDAAYVLIGLIVAAIIAYLLVRWMRRGRKGCSFGKSGRLSIALIPLLASTAIRTVATL